MIIVSQDKEVIVNFNNVENIWINNALENNEGKFKIRAESYSNNMLIGEYKTEERAKEVLEEIIEAYNKSNEDFYVKESETRWGKGEEYLVGYRNKNTNKTYYMPEE